ncbi:MAG TPA: hypothetical protein VFW98_01065 [Gemmatimonadaceae bacterium]|nr:hypothetical protein [Gemmatimonadaceae bacterium]
MNPESRIGPDGRDDEVTRALRTVYAAPDNPAYWEALEARILSRIRSEADGWWQSFSGWGRMGLLAAAVLLMVAGLALTHARESLMQTREQEARLAYQMVMQVPQTLPQQLVAATDGAPAREATLHYVVFSP